MFTVTVHDAQDYEIGPFKKEGMAHAQGSKACYSDFAAFSYTLWCDDTQSALKRLISTHSPGFDASYAMRDLRMFCNPPAGWERITGWRFHKEGFKLLVTKGYIVPADNHLEHEAGFWLLTPHAQKLGLYLRMRRKREWRRQRELERAA